MRLLFIISAKGGVGKSSIAAALAESLSNSGMKIGLIDADVTNPCIPRLTGCLDEGFGISHKISPVKRGNLAIASIQLALRQKGLPIIWEGLMSGRMVEQLFNSIDWEGIENFVIDTPPGVGDEHLVLFETFGRHENAAIIVTTPFQLTRDNVLRSINLCKEKRIRILGLIENFGHYRCPSCKKEVKFASDMSEKLAKENEIRFFGSIPFDLQIAKEGDEGKLTRLRMYRAFKKLLADGKKFFKGEVG